MTQRSWQQSLWACTPGQSPSFNLKRYWPSFCAIWGKFFSSHTKTMTMTVRVTLTMTTMTFRMIQQQQQILLACTQQFLFVVKLTYFVHNKGRALLHTNSWKKLKLKIIHKVAQRHYSPPSVNKISLLWKWYPKRFFFLNWLLIIAFSNKLTTTYSRDKCAFL